MRYQLELGLLGACVASCLSPLHGQARPFERDPNRHPERWIDPINPSAFAIGDIDGDGQADVVHVSRPGRGAVLTVARRANGAWHQSQLPMTSLGAAPSVHPELIDFDGDGDLDLLARISAFAGPLSQAGAILEYYRNDGLGSFSRVRTTAIYGFQGVSTAAGDLDGDGDMDLVVGYLDELGAPTQQLVVAMHDGGFGFDIHLGAIPSVPATAPALADLDGDGDLDLLALDATGQVIRFERRNGAFHGPTPVGTTARSLRVGDLDGDGDADALVQHVDFSISWLRNNAGVLTALTIDPAARILASEPELADLDGDADLDVLLRDSTGNLEVLRYRGAGQFDRELVLNGVAAFGSGDIDGDGVADLILASRHGALDATTLCRGTAQPLRSTIDTGLLRRASGALLGARGVSAFVDLDRDGLEDLVDVWLGDTSIRINQGAGVFRSSPGPTMPSVHAMVAGDIDGDGDEDLVTATHAELQVHVSDGAGTLTSRLGLPLTSPFSVALADLDGDGDKDLVGCSNSGVCLFESLPVATAAPVPLLAQPTAGRIRTAATGDFDADGDIDVIVGSPSNCLQMLRNDGPAGFATLACVASLPFSDTVLDTAVADFDRDGDLDLVVTSALAVQLLLNDGLGSFAVSNGLAITTNTLPIDRVHGIDLNGDGAIDVVTSGLQHAGVWINDGRGRFTRETLSMLANEGLRRTLLIADLDGDGDADLVRSSEPPLFNNLRSLVSTEVAYAGGTLRFAVAESVGSAAGNTLFLPVLSLARRSANLRVRGIAGLLQLDAAGGDVLAGVPLPSGAGRAEFAIAVPASPNFIGVEVFVQGLFIGGNQVGWSPLVRELIHWR